MSSMQRGFKEYIKIALKGGAMGAADVVPGVSGGTIAFITGIYEELIESIKSLDIQAIRLLLTFRFKEFWLRINGSFLLSIALGILVSVVSLARVMSYLLETHPIEVWSLFFGLIVASALMISRQIGRINISSAISLILGVVTAYLITTVTPTTTPDTWWFVTLSGAIAICAMILPGVSGAFLLLLLGKYQYIMEAISTINIAVILQFMVGAVVGIVSFSHLLSMLLRRFHSLTIAMLTGFMIGSLNKVWPWKRVVESFIDRHGESKPLLEANVSPFEYTSISGEPNQLVLAIVLAVIGFALIFTLDCVTSKK